MNLLNGDPEGTRPSSAHPGCGGPGRPVAWALLLLIVAGGAALRLYQIDQRSMWVDEGQSGYMALQPLGRIPPLLKDGDSGGPLWYAAAHFAVQWRPYRVWALRLPAAVFGILTIVLIYALAAELLASRWAGLVAALALAGNLYHIHYSMEARNYSLYFMLAVAAMYCLSRLARARARADAGLVKCLALWAGFVLSSAGMIYTHNVSFLFLAALCAYYPVACWTAGRAGAGAPGGPAGFDAFARPIMQISTALVCIGLLFLPWAPVMLAQLGTVMAGCWIPRPTWLGALRSIGGLVWSGPSVAPGHEGDFPVSAALLRKAGAVFAAAMAGGSLLGWLVWSIRRRDRRVTALGVCLAAAALSVVAISMLAQPIFMSKVVFPFAAVYPLGLAGLATALRGWAGKAARAAAIVLLAAGCGLAGLSAGMDMNAQWKEATACLVAGASADDEPIVVDNVFHLRTVEWYVRGTRYGPVRWDDATPMLLLPGGSAEYYPGQTWGQAVVSGLRQVNRPGQRVWTIHRAGHDLEAEVLDYLAQIGTRIERRKFVGCGVDVYRIDRPPPTTQPDPAR